MSSRTGGLWGGVSGFGTGAGSGAERAGVDVPGASGAAAGLEAAFWDAAEPERLEKGAGEEPEKGAGEGTNEGACEGPDKGAGEGTDGADKAWAGGQTVGMHSGPNCLLNCRLA